MGCACLLVEFARVRFQQLCEEEDVLGLVASALALHGDLQFLQEANGVGCTRVSTLGCAPQLVLRLAVMVPPGGGCLAG